jgi:F-type H+-transporting ATPase subunit gamma
MASIKDLKKRIGSVKNTQQTTKAMKMVSAAKLRRAQDAILGNRPYARQIASLVDRMLAAPGVKLKSPLLAGERDVGAGGKKVLLLLVTSDRGLCAGFNTSIIKTASRWLQENGAKYESVTFSYLGKRGFDFFKQRKGFAQGDYFEALGGKVTFKKANDLSSKLVADFLSGEYDEVKLVYNEFKNAITQTPVVEQFLPLEPAQQADGDAATQIADANLIVKPGPKDVLEALLSKHFAIQVFRAMLESQAGEQGARMSAMENATKNAGEMIRKLTLQYNKQRQAGITKELLEIISGSESSKSKAAS